MPRRRNNSNKKNKKPSKRTTRKMNGGGWLDGIKKFMTFSGNSDQKIQGYENKIKEYQNKIKGLQEQIANEKAKPNSTQTQALPEEKPQDNKSVKEEQQQQQPK